VRAACLGKLCHLVLHFTSRRAQATYLRRREIITPRSGGSARPPPGREGIGTRLDFASESTTRCFSVWSLNADEVLLQLGWHFVRSTGRPVADHVKPIQNET
jgi:hypothetical protein